MSVDWTHFVTESLRARPRLELPPRIKLPVAPQAVIAFNEIVDLPETGPHELAAVLETDGSLTSELLKQINSVAFGMKSKVASLAQAIGLLGPRRTRMLVMTSALRAATKDVKSRLIHMQQFQRENYARAMFAREAAVTIGADQEAAYVGGLIQDILLPLLTEAFYSDYVDILAQEGDLVEKERTRFGWDHASVAATLIRDWGLPDEVVAGVLMHHDPERVIINASLHDSSLVGVVAASGLPESLNQSPSGFETLFVFQDVIPDFLALEVACTVDELLIEQGEDSNLSDRLNQLAMEQLERRRLDRVHQYRKLGNYTLEEQIGEGGMGVVYRARHCMLKRSAAIKLLHSTKISPDALDRFEREVQLTCALTSPHTVAVYDYGVTSEGIFYYVMEHLEGITLAQLVQQQGPLPAGRVIHFLKQACLSLAEAHSNGLIHRDLKPENLMICCRGGIADTVKVLDFGLARVVKRQNQMANAAMPLAGTPRYMPPEAIIRDEPLDARSDLYSLGAVGYFLLTGEPVFPGKDPATVLKCHVMSKPVPPSVRLGKPIDVDLQKIVLNCLEKSRTRRPASATELIAQLSRCRSANSWSNDDATKSWSDLESQGGLSSFDTYDVNSLTTKTPAEVCRTFT